MISKIISISFLLFSISISLKSEVNWNNYSWEKATIIPTSFQSAYWLEFYFLPDNPKYGYAVGSANSNGVYNSKGVFAKTTDSGKTWFASYIDEKTNLYAESVIFIDTNTGYCSGNNALYKTTNGGNAWQLITRNCSWGNYAIGNNVWVAEGTCNITQGQTMYRSTNGGYSWNATIIKEPNSITDFKMLDPKNGYVIGSGAIFLTSDGGISWKKMCNTPEIRWEATTTNINWHEDLNMYNKSILIPAAPSCYGGGNAYEGAAIFSSDFGTTWKTFKTKGSTFGTWLNNDSTGWVCGYYAEVYYTKNYGKDWTLLNCGIDNRASMDDLWFIDDSTGFVGGEDGIYRLARKELIENNLQESMCEGKLSLIANGNYSNYEWFEINDNGDTNKIIDGKNIDIDADGKYLLKYSDCKFVYDTIYDVIEPKAPDIDIKTNKEAYCVGDGLVLVVEVIGMCDSVNVIFGNNTQSYKGNNGISQYTFAGYVNDTTINEVIVECYHTYNNISCVKTINKSIPIYNKYKPILKINGSTTFCKTIEKLLYIENADLFTNNTWYLEKGIIAENVSSYKPTISGTYKVVASNNGYCADTSDAIPLTITNNRNVLSVIGIEDSTFFVDSIHYGKTSYAKLKIYNDADDIFVLDEVTFRYKVAFTAPLSQFPIIFQPNSFAEVIIYYCPTNLGMQYDTIYLNDNCSPLIIPINAYCLGNIDSINSLCDVEIVISTRSITQKEIIKLGLPIPNPTNDKGKISYKIITETNNYTENTNNYTENTNNYTNEKFDLSLYDVMGTKLDITWNDIKLDIETNNKEKIQKGEINFETKKLPNGVYFIRINYDYGAASKVFSIIKN